MSTTNALRTQCVDGSFAHEVVGVDLSKSMNASLFGAIQQALWAHLVLVFRNQQLKARDLARFAKRFGPIVPSVIQKYQHPDEPAISYLTNVEADGSVDSFGVRRASAWHYDGGFVRHPPDCAMLYAIEIPTVGGGTLFADMYRAHNTLAPEFRSRIDELMTVNHFGLGPQGRDYYAALTPERFATYQPIERPLVMRHPVTGKPILKFCMIHTAGFAGIRHDEGYALLDELLDHATSAASYYHRWRPGDLVLWDEHATMHRNASDFPAAERRIMLRAMVGSDSA